jgi:hypothetical protein
LSLWVGCSNNAATENNSTAQTVQKAEDILLGQLKRDHRFETADKQTTVLVESVDEQNRLIKPTITLKREAITIEAESAQIATDYTTNVLTFTLVDVKVIGESTSVALARREIQIPLSDFFPQDKK